MNNIIYLDNNATTKIAPEVLASMLPFLQEHYGNPSSMYSFAGYAERAVKQARAEVADLLGAQPEEIVFTSCGTESDSTAIYAALEAQAGKKHFITSKVEHPAVLAIAEHLRHKGYDITLLEVDKNGNIDLDEFEKSIRPDTALVSLMFANNETGVIFPIAKVGEICKKHGVPLHTDAVQAVGKFPINLATLPVDYLSLSGHKLHAPKGVGALYVRKGAPFRPFLRGGHQEKGKRAGTEAVPNIVALGAACKLAKAHIESEMTTVRALRDYLQDKLLEAVPDVSVNGLLAERLPNTLSLAFKYIEGEAILLLLDQYGICASSGSACTSGSLEPSHVLRAMDVPFTSAHGSIRLSLSRYTTKEELDKIIEVLPPIIERLRKMSPYRNIPEDAKPEVKECACSIDE